MSARLEVRLEKVSYVPGEVVRGTVFVHEGGGARSLEALLEYRETTADYKSTARSVSSGPLHEGDLTTGLAFVFNLSLPGDALPNHRSENGHLYWEVHVKANRRGPDLHERSRIEVALGPGTDPAAR